MQAFIGEALDCRLISLKFEGFFEKWPKNAWSGLSARPIWRPGTARDVATLVGLGLVRESYWRDTVGTSLKCKRYKNLKKANKFIQNFKTNPADLLEKKINYIYPTLSNFDGGTSQ
jgi:hypothetical protein